MGGKGSGRKSATDSLINNIQKQNPIAHGGSTDPIYLPNHSGDHSAGRVRTTPTQDLDLVNKKYVDDTAGGGSSEWTDTGTVLHPTDSSGTVDSVVVGGTTTANSDIALYTTGQAVFNEQGADVDFRVESNNREYALFVNGANGRVGINTSSPQTDLDIENDGSSASITLSSYRTAANHAKFDAYAYRGSKSSPTTLNHGDAAWEMRALGYDGSGLQNIARILMTVDATPSSATPGRISFQTASSTSLVTRMRISKDGYVGINTTSPITHLHVAGGLALQQDTITDNGSDTHTVAIDECVLLVNQQSMMGGVTTIALPAASGSAGRVLTIKNISEAGGVVTIDGNSSETIDGDTTLSLTSGTQFITIICDGSNWHIIGEYR